MGFIDFFRSDPQPKRKRSRRPSGPYQGRLAFDPDSGFHVDEKGRKLVTEDGGKSWRYARAGDTSHVSRYEKRVIEVDTTANARDPEPHHYGVQADDPHVAGLLHDSDPVAETVTSHTEAYRDA